MITKGTLLKIIILYIFWVCFYLVPLVHLNQLQTKKYTTKQHKYAIMNLRDRYINDFESMNYIWIYVRSHNIEFVIFPFLVNNKTTLYFYGLEGEKDFHYEIDIKTTDISYNENKDSIEINFNNYFTYKINFNTNIINIEVNTENIKSSITLNVVSYKSVYPKNLGRYLPLTITNTFDSYIPTLTEVVYFNFNNKVYKNINNTISYLEIALSKEVFYPYIWSYMETKEWTIIYIWHNTDRCVIIKNNLENEFIYMGQIFGSYKYFYKPYTLTIDVRNYISDFDIEFKSSKINISMKSTKKVNLESKIYLFNWKNYLEDYIVNCDVIIEYKNKIYKFNENIWFDIWDKNSLDFEALKKK